MNTVTEVRMEHPDTDAFSLSQCQYTFQNTNYTLETLILGVMCGGGKWVNPPLIFIKPNLRLELEPQYLRCHMWERSCQLPQRRDVIFFDTTNSSLSHSPPPLTNTICIQFFSTEASPGKERETDEVLKEFLATTENAPASNVEAYSAYINKMCKTGNLSAASQMLQTLNDKNIAVTPNVYNLLLVEASQKNDINLSCQVFKKLLLSCKSPSATSCLRFAQAFTKVNDCGELLRFIGEVSKITCSSTSFVNNIIFAFAKSGQMDKALVIFDYLNRHNYSLDLVTYNIVLDILGRTGRVDEMLDLFASMKETGFAPDTVSYNTLLNGLRKFGRSDMCFVYFKEMSENGIEPDLLTYTAIIESFGRSGNAEESLKCFREMKLKGILPSKHIYRSLINNLNKTGKVRLATELLKEMNSSSTCLAGPTDFKQKRRRRNT